MQVTGFLAPHKTLAAFILSLLFLAGTACNDLSESESQNVKRALQDSLLSVTESWNVEIELLEDGLRKVRIEGSYSSTHTEDNKSETRIKGPVHVDVFDSLGHITTRVNSQRAIYRSKQAEFEFFGDVRVNSEGDRKLRSEYLKWSQQSTHVSTPDFVIITTPSDSISGKGFTGTVDLSEYTIKEPTGQFTIDQ